MNQNWTPQQGEIYYFVTSDLTPASTKFDPDYAYDLKKLAVGNCFQTEAEAKVVIKKIKLWLKRK